MNFCENCFADETLKSIVQAVGKPGKCDLCNQNADHVYDTGSNDTLTAYFEQILRLYQPYDEKKDCKEFRHKAHLMQHFIYENWHLFSENVREDQIIEALIAICPDIYENNMDLFNRAVYLRRRVDSKYLMNHGLLRTNTWEDFNKNITRINRFHSNYINLDILQKYLTYLKVKYTKGTPFYRSRISGPQKISLEGMGAPPAEKAVDSRVSANGIQCLYLGDSEDTTLYEVRAAKYDFVSVGKFILKENISVVDLTRIKDVSPFIMPESDIEEFAVNLEELEKLDGAMGKPVRHSDAALDYVPTQYIADFIKSITINGQQTFQGIKYRSVMHSGGFNLAIFEPSLFECNEVSLKQVKEIHYEIGQTK